MPPGNDILVRSKRFTSDGLFVLVFTVNETKTSAIRKDFHWVEVATNETRSSMFESEHRASLWQEGYEFGQMVRKSEEKNARARERRKIAKHS